jgi:hypothetical protein
MCSAAFRRFYLYGDNMYLLIFCTTKGMCVWDSLLFLFGSAVHSEDKIVHVKDCSALVNKSGLKLRIIWPSKGQEKLLFYLIIYVSFPEFIVPCICFCSCEGYSIISAIKVWIAGQTAAVWYLQPFCFSTRNRRESGCMTSEITKHKAEHWI